MELHQNQVDVAPGLLQSVHSLYRLNEMNEMDGMNWMNGNTLQDPSSSVYRDGMWGVNQWDGNGFYSETESRESQGGGGIFDGIGLSDNFLLQYYNKVSKQLTTKTHTKYT